MNHLCQDVVCITLFYLFIYLFFVKICRCLILCKRQHYLLWWHKISNFQHQSKVDWILAKWEKNTHLHSKWRKVSSTGTLDIKQTEHEEKHGNLASKFCSREFTLIIRICQVTRTWYTRFSSHPLITMTVFKSVFYDCWIMFFRTYLQTAQNTAQSGAKKT